MNTYPKGRRRAGHRAPARADDRAFEEEARRAEEEARRVAAPVADGARALGRTYTAGRVAAALAGMLADPRPAVRLGASIAAAAVVRDAMYEEAIDAANAREEGAG